MKSTRHVELKDTMPHSIKDDPNVSVAAESIDVQLKKVADASDSPAIYARLNALPTLALDHLAKQFNIYPWRDYWDKKIKTQVITAVIVTKRKKGTMKAVKSCLEAFGGNVYVVPWHEQSPPGDPGTFLINVLMSDNGLTSVEIQEDVYAMIEEAKPKSRHCTMVVGQTIKGGVHICGCVRPVVYTKLCNF